MPAEGPQPGPDARTAATTAYGHWTPAACPKEWQPEEDERLTPDPPHEGTRHPPWGRPPAPPCSAQQQLARACGVGSVPSSHTRSPRIRRRGAADPGCLPKGRTAGGGRPPNLRRPSPRKEEPPPGRATSSHPRGMQRPTGHASQGTIAGSLSPPICTQGPWAGTLTADLKGGQPGEGERLCPDTRRKSKKQPPGDALRPPPERTTPACKTVRCGIGAGPPYPHLPRPENKGSGPGVPAQRAGRWGRVSAEPQTPLTAARGAVLGNLLPPPRHAMPGRACRPGGHCPVPAPVHPQP